MKCTRNINKELNKTKINEHEIGVTKSDRLYYKSSKESYKGFDFNTEDILLIWIIKY